ncbi:IS200/IS605 family element transposase accessory protein TnpB [Duganella sp. FT92W]|uniref:IS200/IS605 family element transposase accessory protein TnpB n=1 Tax=Pseudoduganella rivuli TaxID=2666085 RepID=A0A7X2LXF8_9BURK|nr:RNA-guided endonuclease TnpB family protein [Pseudoduganella rivuli]MRV76157.1 IS200/IS605 family element transposase accessory protein TnpB [Pseudoduganella rivuli]
MELAHRIELKPTGTQADYFVRACGTVRFVWNWALDEWNKQYAKGGKPNALRLKKQFNAIKYIQFPWLKEMHRDAHAQPFRNLGRAWERFFNDVKAGKRRAPDDRHARRRLKAQGIALAYPPQPKRKGACSDSFYVANDKFEVAGHRIRLPKLGWVGMTEALRFDGKILGAVVSRTADRWYVAVQVDVPGRQATCRRTADGEIGVDLGIKTAVSLSNGEKIDAPMPLGSALRRLRIRGRRHSRKVEAAKRFKREFIGPLQEPTRMPRGRNQVKSARRLARMCARIARLRRDFTHKLTTRLCRENQAIGIEDLNVAGMLRNECLARPMVDVGMAEFSRQLAYKAQRYGTRLVIASRWYPSSRLCSCCGWKNITLTLKDRAWNCAQCGAQHDRDLNAAINLLPDRIAQWNARQVERFATVAQAKTALPVASSAVTPGTGAGMGPANGGKVTSVSDEFGLQDGSGQKSNRVHF